MAPPDTLYHYTGETALLSILSGGGAREVTSAIRASDALFLNDSKELLAGREPLIEALNSFLEEKSADPRYTLEATGSNYFSGAVAYFSNFISRFGETSSRPPRVFVACFCEDPDLLSQWRSYGQGGYCIGFDREILEKEVKPQDFTPPRNIDFYSRPLQAIVRKVAYSPAEVQKALVAEMDWYLDPAAGGLRGWQSYGELHVLQSLARVKHPAFESEREWRLIYVRRGGVLGWENMPHTQADFRPAADVRSGTNSAVPFLAMEFPKLAIRSIVVGPGGDTKLRRLAVERVCEDLELDVSIESSAVPYRG